MLFANPGAAPRQAITPIHAHHGTNEIVPAVWWDLLDPSEDERSFAERATGLRVPSKEELSEIETSSRGYIANGALYLSTPMVYRSEDGSSRIAPLGLVLGRDHLMTVRYAKLPVFEIWADRFASQKDPAPCSVSAFTGLIEAIVDRLADVLERVGGDLDTLSRRVFRRDHPVGGGRLKAGSADATQPRTKRRNAALADAELRATLRAVGHAGDTLSNIRDALLGVSRLVRFAAEQSNDWMPPALRPRFKTLQADLLSLSDYDTQLANKVQFLLDATLGFINIEQNNGIKVLTVVSVVGVPPTLVASIYGMNFKHMPELDWVWGYPYGLVVIIASAILPLVWFRMKGWI